MYILFFSTAAEIERVTARNNARKDGEPFATFCGQRAVTPEGNISFTFAVNAADLGTAEVSKKTAGAQIVARVDKLELVTPTH